MNSSLYDHTILLKSHQGEVRGCSFESLQRVSRDHSRKIAETESDDIIRSLIEADVDEVVEFLIGLVKHHLISMRRIVMFFSSMWFTVHVLGEVFS